jgi:outer membrane protein TolC
MWNLRCRFVVLAVSACVLGFAAESRAQSPAARAADVLTLDQAIALAMRDNPKLRNASLDVERSQQALEAGRTRRLPSFNFNAVAAQQLTPIDFTFERGVFGTYPGVGPIPSEDTKISTSTRPTAIFTTRISQPLSQLHQINLNINLLELKTEIADEELRSAKLEITVEVKRAYYTLLQTESALKATEETIRMYEELDRVTTDFLAQQVALKTDSLDVKSRLARSEYDRQTLLDQAEIQKQQLNQLLGRDVLTEFSVAGVPDADVFESDVSLARQQALEQRPEVREARLKVKQAEVDRRVKKADYIPEVSVGFQHVATAGFDNFIPKNYMNVGVTVTWEVFDWGRKKHELAEKDLITEQARNTVRDAERGVLVEVNDRFNHLREARQFLAVTQLGRDAAVENARVLANRYKVQKSMLKDVLQAQSELEQANDQTRQALLRFWTAKAEFENAIGKEQ